MLRGLDLAVNLTSLQKTPCRAVLHFHIGDTGGTEVNRLFTSSTDWAVVTLSVRAQFARYAPRWRSGAMAPDRLLKPRSAEARSTPSKLYLEVHCSISLKELVETELPAVRAALPRCTLEAFTVVRDPIDWLCSMCRRQHNDFHSGFMAGHVRQHNLDVLKYGLASCMRRRQPANADDVEEMQRLLWVGSVQPVALSQLDAKMTRFGFKVAQPEKRANAHISSGSHTPNQLHQMQLNTSACDEHMATHNATAALQHDIRFYTDLFPDQRLRTSCSHA